MSTVVRDKFRANQDYFSEKISDLTRFIGFGLVAVAFSLLSTKSEFSQFIIKSGGRDLIIVGFVGCVAILFDYLQLAFGWWASSAAANNKAGGYVLNRRGRGFRFCQQSCFYIKQLVVIAGVVLLLRVIYAAVGEPLVDL